MFAFCTRFSYPHHGIETEPIGTPQGCHGESCPHARPTARMMGVRAPRIALCIVSSEGRPRRAPQLAASSGPGGRGAVRRVALLFGALRLLGPHRAFGQGGGWRAPWASSGGPASSGTCASRGSAGGDRSRAARCHQLTRVSRAGRCRRGLRWVLVGVGRVGRQALGGGPRTPPLRVGLGPRAREPGSGGEVLFCGARSRGAAMPESNADPPTATQGSSVPRAGDLALPVDCR